MEIKFKHLDLIEEKQIDIKELQKNKEIKAKMQGFGLWKGNYEKNNTEEAGLRAEKISDELVVMINAWLQTASSKPKAPALSEEQIIAKAAEKLAAQQKAEAEKEAARIKAEALKAEQEAAAEQKRLADEAAEAKRLGDEAEAKRIKEEAEKAEAEAKAEQERLEKEAIRLAEEAKLPFNVLFGNFFN